MSLTFHFVGDIAFTDLYDEIVLKHGPHFPFLAVQGLLSGCALLIGNLEGPLTANDRPFPDKTPLKGNPRYIQGLRQGGFDVLNLSNNHILDHQEDGVKETISLLNKAGIKHFGYGNNREEAIRMACCEKDGVKLGFMGYTDIPIDSPFWANEKTRGIAKIDVDTLPGEIRKSCEQVDFLVVSLHWGIENFWLPSPDQRILARKIIDSGADLVIGHHPHVIQGVENWKNGLIAYSLGNFVFSDINWKWKTKQGELRNTIFKMNRTNRESMILKVEWDGARIGHKVIGVTIGKSGQVRKAPYIEKKARDLSLALQRPDYDEYFARELKKFERSTKLSSLTRRIVRIHKIRPKHVRELLSFLRKDA
jgi:poly-gamma-glutamate capsule biosynthesis protein CapA/YwtB (metallophosphatase superfamily)